MKFIITIDTEEDNQWAKDGAGSTKNADYIPRFQKLVEEFELKPTYLVTYGMSRNSRFREFLRQKIGEGLAEVGAHLHPWANPPEIKLTPDDNKFHPMPHELPEQAFREKMDTLVDSIKRGFGISPTSYRAGRWGFDSANAEVLLELGIRVDSSVTPNISWRHLTGIPGGKGGMDYLHAPVEPYFVDIEDVTRPGNSGLLEVPVTILFTRFPLRNFRFFRNYFRNHRESPPMRALDRMGFGPRWLRPYPDYSAAELIRVYRTARKLRLPAVVMMLHSSELMPGGSPYYPDERSVERLYRKVRTLFSYARKDGTEGATLTEFAEEWRTNR